MLSKEIRVFFLCFRFFRYRKVTGDTCQGGDEDLYEADMVSCPIRRKGKLNYVNINCSFQD